jgi:alpha-L-fucosidase
MNRLKTLLIAISIALPVFAQVENLPICEGKYNTSDESLKQYKCPEWFRDAKFGIWSCWGPQAVPGWSSWAAKLMYIGPYYMCENGVYIAAQADYTHFLTHYGHPSEVGYKDLIPLWKAEKWNPEEQMKLFKRAGAKYFATIAIFHDNFSLWNTKLNRWNSVNMGPKKDVVGIWQQAAKKEGLYFGVTEHLGASYTWFQSSHGADQLGDKAGVPYDGANPEYQDLYHEKAAPDDVGGLTINPKWHRDWFDRIQELVDMYHPDLLYSDSELPFGDVGRSLLAHYYNSALKYNKKGVVYNCKLRDSEGRWVKDYEVGAAEGIEYPWQTDTSVGDWFFRPADNYKNGTEIIQMLVDIVSKNGNLLLNVAQTPEGFLDDHLIKVLEEVGDWMQVNGEAIYSTRPWKIYGEGLSVAEQQERGIFDGVKDVRPYKQGDLRFTMKGKTIYVFCMESPESDIRISSLGLKAATGQKVKSISLLGSNEKISWTQNNDEVIIQKPAQLPEYKTVVFAIK